jgi:hypothetical protein
MDSGSVVQCFANFPCFGYLRQSEAFHPARWHADPALQLPGSSVARFFSCPVLQLPGSSVGWRICRYEALLAALISHQFHEPERAETKETVGGGNFEHQALLFEKITVDGRQGM